ncbi:acyloxyacyl hydrolase [Parvicella tangerina]|uniref:acyloxyacyl hydrolase n=1 Tax=Parvicella tangerina TaxID=2829795 RepID=UPI00215C841A|nr:acyloxyacyl hydrolase [Parvicella tangerina]
MSLLFCAGITAQSQFGKYLDINGAFGSFVPHKQAVKHLQSGPSVIGEVAYTLRTDGSDFHHQPYRLPYFGLMLGVADGGNRNITGLQAYLTTFGAIPLYRSDHPLVIKMGMGLGFVQGIYNKFTNPKQNAIGSHFNVNIQLRLEKNFTIGKGGGFNTGLGISHFSNASFSSPNLGMNYIHLFIGKRFTLQKHLPQPDSVSVISILPYTPRKIELELHAGVKGTSKAFADKHPIINGSAHYTKQFSIKHAWSNGLDFYYNKALDIKEGKLFQIGISSVYILNFDEIKLGAGLGYYLLNRPSISKGFYSNVFFQYFFNGHWFTKIKMRTHRTVADFFTLGIGYTL